MLDSIKDIEASVWISASAGTGKTKSLIDRIIALLLNGVNPAKILCLTYTKAAAAEMLSRLSALVRHFSQISDDELINELSNLGFNENAMASNLSIAKSLYEKSLLASEWVQIQTIHSFCFKILEKFPLETGLLPGITICDDQQKKQLIKIAVDKVVFAPENRDYCSTIARFTQDISDIFEKDLPKIQKFLATFHDFESLYCNFFNIENSPQNRQMLFAPESENTQESHEMSLNRISASANIAFFSIIRQVFTEFSEQKRANHCIDFDDVISLTSSLLNSIEWVMYKIDNSIEHLLLDEAQDTSPEQWEIINTITDEFFANYQSSKTVFVVGDEKQSIYSFQGADVQIFKKMHDKFEQRSINNGQRFHNVELNKSYRTTGNILSFVDDVFKTTKHETNRCAQSGVVEIVDLFKGDKEADDDGANNNGNKDADIWNAVKLSEQTAQTSTDKLARYIARFIKNTIDSHTFVESKNRAATESDFMILFQRRDIETMRKIIHQLHALNIAVSGIDRTLLKDELIVEDLIAFAQFAIFKSDDLVCARVLKSPIVGISEEELMQLCLNRSENSLWEYLLTQSELCDKYSIFQLKKFIDKAFYLSAYDFFSQILINGIKEKFIVRLGEKCLEALYDFINIVIDYEKENTPSLQSFLIWFKAAGENIVIKHEAFSDSNCVRLMTVHASKGLQAPFVILADTQYFNNKGEKIIKSHDNILLWNFAADKRAKAVKELYEEYNQSKQDESRRRLYVALTRAEDFVCILGQQQNRAPHKNCWYNLIINNANFEKFTENNKTMQNDSINIRRFGDINKCAIAAVPISEKKQFDIPGWFYEKLDIIDFEAESASEIEPEKNESSLCTKKSPEILYGDCIHLLLSELPPKCHLCNAKQSAAISDLSLNADLNLLADAITSKFDLSDKLKSQAKAEVFAILSRKDLEFIFAPNSFSEISFIDSMKKENRIDKIAFLNEDVWIIDFKSGHEKVQHKYIEQLRRYKQIAAALYKDRNIKTAILWTSNAHLTDVFF